LGAVARELALTMPMRAAFAALSRAQTDLPWSAATIKLNPEMNERRSIEMTFQVLHRLQPT
jgi:hypothetical protein